MSFNTIFPNDFGYWELVNELVQQEPPDAADPELLGLLAAVGIVHGQPFEPDARMRKILEDAVVVGNATARTVTFAPRPEEGFAYYPNSQWCSALFVGGYEFLDPPPQITADGPVAAAERRRPQAQFPHQLLLHGHRHHAGDVHAPHRASARSTSSRCETAMASTSTARATIASRFRPTSPRVASGRCCSTTGRPAPCSKPTNTCPRLGSQSGTVEANADGSTDIYFGPTAPEGKEANWLQTVPGKGWWTILRLYNPLQSFFDKTWRPSEIEPI